MRGRIVIGSDLKISSIQRKTFDIDSNLHLSVSFQAHIRITDQDQKLTSVGDRNSGTGASV